MSVLKIALISPHLCGTAYTCIKKAAGRLGDKNYRFDFLPRVGSIYEQTGEGELLRSRLFSKKPDLTAVFFDPGSFEQSMRILLETMEYSPRTVVIIEDDGATEFNAETFSGTLGVDCIPYENSAESVLNILDVLRTFAVSLFYASPAYINYGAEAEYALSLLERSARDVFGVRNKTWAAARLLRGGVFLRELFIMFDVDIYERKTLYEDISTAALYLHNCTPSIDFPKHAEAVFSSITETLKESCFKKDDLCKDSPYSRAFWVILYALASVCALTLAGMIFFD